MLSEELDVETLKIIITKLPTRGEMYRYTHCCRCGERINPVSPVGDKRLCQLCVFTDDKTKWRDPE